MRYGSAGAFRTALERRLQTLAEQGEIPLVRLRKLVVFDRLLARLLVAAPDRWVLKGAVALHFRVGPQFRTTRDLDLGRHDDEQAAMADFRLAQSVELGDYFTFAIQRTRKLDELLEGVAVRYHVTAQVDGRRFEDVTVDVGFTDPPAVEPEVLRGPDLLNFADIPPAEVPTLPLEQHIAEKVHAYTRAYASHQPSTRVKDLVDLVLISSLFPFQAGRLRRALHSTFDIRHPRHARLANRPSTSSVGLGYALSSVGSRGRARTRRVAWLSVGSELPGSDSVGVCDGRRTLGSPAAHLVVASGHRRAAFDASAQR